MRSQIEPASALSVPPPWYEIRLLPDPLLSAFSLPRLRSFPLLRVYIPDRYLSCSSRLAHPLLLLSARLVSLLPRVVVLLKLAHRSEQLSSIFDPFMGRALSRGSISSFLRFSLWTSDGESIVEGGDRIRNKREVLDKRERGIGGLE